MAIQDFLFGKTKYKPIRISDPLQTSIDKSTGASLDRYRQRKGSILDAFQGVVDRTQPKIEAAGDLGLADINAGSSILRSFDPTGAYERLREGNLSSLQRMTDMLSGVGRRQEAQAAARLGLAGRPTSSARDILRSSSLASAFAPVANTIYGNLGRDVGVIGNQTTSTADALTRLAMARPDLYGNIYQYSLAPLAAEQMGLEGETSALNALAQAVRSNYGGMDVQQKMGLLDYPVRMTESLAGTVGNLADAAGSVGSIMGSVYGMGGMGGGGFGGMGIGSASSPNMAAWGNFMPMTSGMSFGMPGGYNFSFGAPRALDVNMMNPWQLAMLQRAQREAAQNVPYGSVWE